jgi:hypothetical protein
MVELVLVELVSTVYGHAVVLARVSYGRQEAYRLRLTENSQAPGTIIEFYPVEKARPLDDEESNDEKEAGTG